MSAGLHSSPRVEPKALLVLAVAGVLSVVTTAAISPGIVAILHNVGVAEATLDGVAIRTLELVAIALTFVALMLFGGGGMAAWGVPRRRAAARRLGLGFVLGLLSLGVVCMLLYAFQVRVVRHDLSLQPGYWLRVVALAMSSAMVIGVLEELWFRGGLFTLLRRCGGVVLAMFGGSLLYAATHFLAIPGGLDGSESRHWGGFEVLEAAAQNMFQLQHLDSFVALFIAGLTLGLVRLRQGDVALCIGIHTGWVLVIKVFKKLTYVSPAATNRFLAGSYDDVIGWVATACLAVMLVLLWRFLRPEQRPEQGLGERA